jgi:hypothetical protein
MEQRIAKNVLDILTPWKTVHVEKLIVAQVVKKFPAFHGTRRFITVFTTALHRFLMKPDHSFLPSSYKIYLKFRVFWDVTPCSHVEVYRRFRGAYCLHHQGDSSP